MQAQSPLSLFSESEGERTHAQRLIEGMALALSEKRYTEVTIADVVRHARMSKRTFYEHFSDKEACYLATYGALNAELLRRIARAAQQEAPGEAQVHAAAKAYFRALEEQRPLVRAFLSEIHAAGPAALEMRRSVHKRFAELLRGLVEQARKVRKDVAQLSPDMAVALVGGINELILLHLAEGDGSAQLTPVRNTAVELISRVLKLR
jgi:AcrR family transcriptional regulator